MTVVSIPHECLIAAGLKVMKVDTRESITGVKKCYGNGRCILDNTRRKHPVVQEFEKPEYCPLRKLGRRSDNHD